MIAGADVINHINCDWCLENNPKMRVYEKNVHVFTYYDRFRVWMGEQNGVTYNSCIGETKNKKFDHMAVSLEKLRTDLKERYWIVRGQDNFYAYVLVEADIYPHSGVYPVEIQELKVESPVGGILFEKFLHSDGTAYKLYGIRSTSRFNLDREMEYITALTGIEYIFYNSSFNHTYIQNVCYWICNLFWRGK